jgi:hypothetical protein
MLWHTTASRDNAKGYEVATWCTLTRYLLNSTAVMEWAGNT